MKAAYLLSLALGLAVHAAHAQAQPKKGDNVILVQTPDSAGTALKKLGRLFVAQGYTVEKFDPQFLTLTLAPKTMGGTFNHVFTARATASEGTKSTLKLAGDYTASFGVA